MAKLVQHGMLADFSVAQRNRPHRWFPQSAYSLTEPGTSSFPFTLTGMNSIETANKIDNKYYIKVETCKFVLKIL